MGTLKCVCSYLSRDIRPNQLEHTLLRVPIALDMSNICFDFFRQAQLKKSKQIFEMSKDNSVTDK